MILAADVGGTKTHLGLFRRSGARLTSVREQSFPSQEFASLEAIVAEFVGSRTRTIDRCSVGVAGPVVGGRSQVVNLRWPVDANRLALRLGLDHVTLLNDLEANAWGIAHLPPRKLINLTPGVRSRGGNAALISAGTGLGMAILFPDGDRLRPSASEGGHQEFAPRDDLEIELLRFLRKRHGRVSIERVVAGPGFSAIYRFLIEHGWGRESAEMARRLAAADDPNGVISEAGLEDRDPVARMTLQMFVSLFGAAAGDLALVSKSTAGVFVGGGIAPKILPELRRGEFVQSFRRKGRLTPLLEQIPVKVIVEPRTALIGAAAAATDPSTGSPGARRSRNARRRRR
ncbi:MAG TPA: glucokinase [Candidatus Polarisedimenticolaceae bacterium]|nr:glucokinase [Candidatus Polarisedimenticolaceae bacterium]